jgi:membrane protein implicated in regulation of membrane protease activity
MRKCYGPIVTDRPVGSVAPVDGDAWRWIWLAFAVGGVIGEIATAGTFFLFPFGIGAAVACVLAFLSVALGFQWLAFVLVSIAAFAATRPLARRLDAAGPGTVGANRWVGRQGIVLRAIGAHEAGIVRIGGEEWRAETREAIPVTVGSTVLVVDVEGTRLIVLPLELAERDV